MRNTHIQITVVHLCFFNKKRPFEIYFYTLTRSGASIFYCHHLLIHAPLSIIHNTPLLYKCTRITPVPLIFPFSISSFLLPSPLSTYSPSFSVSFFTLPSLFHSTPLHQLKRSLKRPRRLGSLCLRDRSHYLYRDAVMHSNLSLMPVNAQDCMDIYLN